jgi:hypothetical protein
MTVTNRYFRLGGDGMRPQKKAIETLFADLDSNA